MDVVFNGKLYPAGSDILLDRREVAPKQRDDLDTKYTFTIPVWVKDKVSYEAEVWVAPLGNKGDIPPQKHANILASDNSASGIATDDFKIDVIGKIYDFTVTNIQGDESWKEMLKLPTDDTTMEYKSLNIAALNKDLPIAQESHRTNTKYNYALKKGTKIYFSVNTKGVSNSEIKIEPKYYYVSKDGKAQYEVDAYTKVNNKYTNLSNITTTRTSNTRNANKETREYLTEKHLASSEIYKDKVKYDINTSIGTYKQIILNNSFKFPYENYLTNTINGLPTIFKHNYTLIANTYRSKILEAVSHWYGDYLLPYDARFAKLGTSGTESNFSKHLDGYVIVLFKIDSYDTENNLYLPYKNVWIEEGMQETIKKLPSISPKQNSPENVSIKALLEQGYAPIAIYQTAPLVSVDKNYDSTGTH